MRRLLPLLFLALPVQAQIAVTSATYGPVTGNATAKVAAACDGQTICSYPVWYYNFFPDPAPNKPKTFSASWTCPGIPFTITAWSTPLYQGVEAGYGSIVLLSCAGSPTPIPTPTPIPVPTPISTPTPRPTPSTPTPTYTATPGPVLSGPAYKVIYTCTPPADACRVVSWTLETTIRSTTPGVTITVQQLP